MNAAMQFASRFWSGELAVWWVDVWIRSVVALMLAAALCLCWRRASAATRHGVWLTALLSLPFLLIAASLPSPTPRPLWSLSGQSPRVNEVRLSLEITPNPSTGNSGIPSERTASGTPDEARSWSATRWSAVVTADSWRIVAAIWLMGAGFLLTRFVLGQIQLRRLAREASPIDDLSWSALLQECQERLDLKRHVRLVCKSGDVMPLTWGVLEPAVLLPSSASAWTVERRRIVLLHELAHVKRRDCLARQIARLVCAGFWLNPLVWLVERRMELDRERACDDLVLNGGCRASDYAGHLVDIARSFRRPRQIAGIAMARPTGLEQRVNAILDRRRNRKRIERVAIGVCVMMMLSVEFLANGNAGGNTPGAWSLDRSPAAGQLKRFVAEKKAQAEEGCRAEGKEFLPEFTKLFSAAASGDWLTISNSFEDLRLRAPQYEHRPGATNDLRLHGIAWEAIKEVWGAFYSFAVSGEKYSLVWSDEIIHSIPAGSVYFGGTDPGRFLITAMARSQIHGDPFFILTQNAMADNSYLDYARSMYGGRIYIPTKEDSKKCFDEYIADASDRLAHDEAFPNEEKQVKWGESLTRGRDGKVQVSGQVAVMSINGLLTKIIFDKVPEREFYVEESFALDWMYPYLEPHGLIMKIDRKAMAELPTEVVSADRKYWTKFVNKVLGDWLTQGTSVQQISDFANRVYVQRDLGGFRGDPVFIENRDPGKMFSKLRSSIAGVYAWRAQHAHGEADRRRMVQEADFAFRQAWAICPDSPEAVFRYVTLLIGEKRTQDALVVAQTALALDPQNPAIDSLIQQLRKMPAGR